MTISYNWLSEYLPITLPPEQLSDILTSVGLEVENMEQNEEIPGGLKGLIIGEVIECSKHPEADKLSVTKVNVGNEILQIVCGAPNVAVGQKVIVAPIGATIYPIDGEPLTMKKAKIRGVESFGMICAEDEIGLGKSHEGILVLPSDLKTGSAANNYFKSSVDWIYEIGLTPNRMDAMSHLGVAKDVCAWYNHHNNADIKVRVPFNDEFKPDNNDHPISVFVRDSSVCPRYAGVTLSGLTIKESPKWLQQRLKSIGLKPINNIVDITNFILHETGQPLHAFDLNEIKENKIIVGQVEKDTPFVTLDGKERKLRAEDIMICDGKNTPMCIGGVFGGSNSGVKQSTTSIFLESAVFNPSLIRKTLLHHGLRTDASVRFEKGVDISKTVSVLKRAAALIKEIAGGEISSDIIDCYPAASEKKRVTLEWQYLDSLSGKKFDRLKSKKILEDLNFVSISHDENAITFDVPFSNPDISIQADIVEEIMRIDGLDNIDIPSVISIAPSVEKLAFENNLREKISGFLCSNGFTEMLTNSITNSAYYNEDKLASSVKIINGLSVELDLMKPEMLQTALECIVYNINRKNNDLFFFEFGKTYSLENGQYSDEEHLMIYISTSGAAGSWKSEKVAPDIYYLRGICEKICSISGVSKVGYSSNEDGDHLHGLKATVRKAQLASLGYVSKNLLNKFSIRQPVLALDLNWRTLIQLAKEKNIVYAEISKYPPVHRELSIVVDKNVQFEKLQTATKSAGLQKLSETKLLNIFESDKLGENKKSFALSYTFFDKEKTLTDKEIDGMMTRLMSFYERDLGAQIRKG